MVMHWQICRIICNAIYTFQHIHVNTCMKADTDLPNCMVPRTGENSLIANIYWLYSNTYLKYIYSNLQIYIPNFKNISSKL